MKEIILPPIKETTEDYEAIEKYIASVFKKEIYLPLLESVNISKSILKNSNDDLIQAIESGRITFYRGQFKGRFSSVVSRELKKTGAKWDRTHGSWKIPFSKLPNEIRDAIHRSELYFKTKIGMIDRKLQRLFPADFAGSIKLDDLFDKALWKTEKKIQDTLKKITIEPTFSPEQRRRIASEYEKNMQLYIKDWTQKEIIKLRQKMQKHVLMGNRYEDVIDTIKKSYGVSHNKAKFLARQETNLLMTKFKELRYTEAGVNEYIWRCVVGSPDHPVRPTHKALNGTRQRWDRPPVSEEDGSRHNAGISYNCRCVALPIVKFKEKSK